MMVTVRGVSCTSPSARFTFRNLNNISIMEQRLNNPERNEKNNTIEKRKWVKPELLEEDYSKTKDLHPPMLPGDPEQAGS